MVGCFRFPCVLVLKMIVIKPVRTVGMIARPYRWPSKVLIIFGAFQVVGTTGQYGLLDRTSSRRQKQGSQSNNGTTSRYRQLDRSNSRRRKMVFLKKLVRSISTVSATVPLIVIAKIFVTICLLFSFTFCIKKLRR